MASNNKLVSKIETEAKAKGIDVPVTNGLNNDQLAETLKNLKAMAPAPATPIDEAVKAAEDEAVKAAEDEAVKAKPAYYMGERQSLTTLKGIRADGDEIKAEYLIDGVEGLKRHVKSGAVIKS